MEKEMSSLNTEPSFNPIKAAKEHPESRAKAIAAFCATCLGYPQAGWRGEIRNCTSRDCPLYIHRPYRWDSPEQAKTGV